MDKKIVNGTHYDLTTPNEVVELLEKLRTARTCVTISYGDSKSGKDWLEESDTVGRIGRSTGSQKIPLLVPKGADGGPALLDSCIVRIRNDKKVLWQHGTYHCPKLVVATGEYQEKPLEVLADGKIHARFKTLPKLKQWIKKLGVEVENVP